MNKLTEQDFIAFEMHRWKHEGRWTKQGQAMRVAQSKFLKYLKSGHTEYPIVHVENHNKQCVYCKK